MDQVQRRGGAVGSGDGTRVIWGVVTSAGQHDLIIPLHLSMQRVLGRGVQQKEAEAGSRDSNEQTRAG